MFLLDKQQQDCDAVLHSPSIFCASATEYPDFFSRINILCNTVPMVSFHEIALDTYNYRPQMLAIDRFIAIVILVDIHAKPA